MGSLFPDHLQYLSALCHEIFDTGFSSFPRGHEIIPQPGGIWDHILLEYCDGIRSKPVWTIGESDFRKEIDDIANPTTVFVGPVHDSRDVLSSLKDGRFYALDSPDKDLFLDQFCVINKEKTSFASMGQTIHCSSDGATVHVDIKSKYELKKVVLIKNGLIIKEVKESYFEYVDRSYPAKRKNFYRLIVESVNGSKIFANPIFVTN